MRIQNNTTAFDVWTNYTQNTDRLKKSMQKLSSGYISNTDDPAGIGISERMRAQVKGTAMARQNTDNAVSLVQTADSWLQKVNDQVSRMKALAIEANGIMSQTDKENVQTEFKAMQEEITRITSKYTSAAKFNGLYLFRGGNGVAIVTGDQIDGAGGSGYYTGSSDYTGAVIGAVFKNAVDAFLNPDICFWIKNNVGSPVVGSDAYAATLNNALATNSAFSTSWSTNFNVNDLTDARAKELYTQGPATLNSEDLHYLQRKMMDYYFWGFFGPPSLPKSTTAYVAGEIAKNISVQIGADVDQKIDLTLKNLQVSNSQVIGTVHTYSYNASQPGTVAESSHDNVTWASIINVNNLSVSSDNAVGKIDKAIDFVANARASMGAQQKRVENTRSGLLTYEDNLTAAESQIRDVDMARESTNLATYQILTQASTAMLSQANQMSSSVMTLLG